MPKSTTFRQMRNEVFKTKVLAGIREPHVQPINALVDELVSHGRGSVPYVAPTYGGIHARALFIFRDPGPATIQSQMLCHQNNDQSAQRFSEWLQSAEIPPSAIMTWNAYPWYINTDPNDDQLIAAAPVLDKFLKLLKDVRVVIRCGRRAEDAWVFYCQQFPAGPRPSIILDCPHTSHMGLLSYGGRTRDQNIEYASKVYRTVSEIIKAPCDERLTASGG